MTISKNQFELQELRQMNLNDALRDFQEIEDEIKKYKKELKEFEIGKSKPLSFVSISDSLTKEQTYHESIEKAELYIFVAEQECKIRKEKYMNLYKEYHSTADNAIC